MRARAELQLMDTPESTEIANLLACPRCDTAPLDQTPKGYRCPACSVDFPSFEEIPWLFAEPVAALGEWRNRFGFALSKLDQEHKQLGAALQSELGGLTRQRLSDLATATQDHAQRLRVLLAPLQLDSLTASYESYLALRTRLPSDQGLTTYYNNVHRDWAWGNEENDASFNIIKDALADSAPGVTLILGAGAGRLAYDIHMRTASDATVVLDFNPLLLLLARRIMRGETVEMYEFPIAPKTMHEQSVLRTLAAEEPARKGLYYVLADAHRPPFARGSFDTIVTPWLIDILPERFETLCTRINAQLSERGRWINFGSLSFHDPDPALNYNVDECLQAVIDAGFDLPKVTETTIPYMCSPASRHGRREQVLSWAASKKRNVRKVPRHEALPEWLVRGKDPVPLLESFKMQAMSTRIHAFIMSLIDGKRSLDDMADVLAEQKLMTRAEAEPAIRSFLIKMYEDSRRI